MKIISTATFMWHVVKAYPIGRRDGADFSPVVSTVVWATLLPGFLLTAFVSVFAISLLRYFVRRRRVDVEALPR